MFFSIDLIQPIHNQIFIINNVVVATAHNNRSIGAGGHQRRFLFGQRLNPVDHPISITGSAVDDTDCMQSRVFYRSAIPVSRKKRLAAALSGGKGFQRNIDTRKQ